MALYEFSKTERALLEGMRQPFAIYQFVDKRVVAIILSDGFLELLGYTDREQAYHDMNTNMYKDTYPEDAARVANAALKFATEGGRYEVVYRSKIKNSSEYRIIHSIGEHVITETGERLAHVWYTDEGIYKPGTELSSTSVNLALDSELDEEEELKESRYDFMTGLPSMTYFFELAAAGIKAIEDSGDKPVLLFTDMSGMRFFNEKYSFAEGDKLIKAFAGLLKQTFSNENCCHIGGDHFAIYTKREQLEDVLDQLFADCREMNEGRNLPVRVGIYTDMEDVPVSTACSRAKLACDEMRDTYQSDYAFYYQELSNEELQHQYVLENIEKAIEEKWIKVYYQPIVRAVSGHVCDEEALSRWIDPNKGMITPDEFIPALEQSKLIYKLDLYVLDQVLEKMCIERESGIPMVPHSVNLSRADFETCDIVQEVCDRVDAAGIGRDMITIEITESVVGNEFDYMKEQVERFQNLGFAVWMDDFGSGYSSLDVLQNIRFDLLKFDMNFLRRMEEGNSGKIIMTELMRMATSLGVDTICEGVETREQVRFLKDIGCSKLQGFYYSRPISFEALQQRIKEGVRIGFENTEESAYFAAIGRMDLNNIYAIANKSTDLMDNFFDSIPMGIVEVFGSKTSLIRSKSSFRGFMSRMLDTDLSAGDDDNRMISPGGDTAIMHLVSQCRESDGSVPYDDHRPDGTTVHYLARRISKDPVADRFAVAVAVLSVSDAAEGASYVDIARALASDYYTIYYIDLDTDDFIEYGSQTGGESLAVERHGRQFFKAVRRDIGKIIYEADRATLMSALSKDRMIRDLDEQGAYTITYRLLEDDKPIYASMKITRMPDGKHIIIGVSIIDSQMKEKELTNELMREKDALARVMSLSEDYLSIYSIDCETNRFFEYGATDEFETLGIAKTGEDFFEATMTKSRGLIHPDDEEEYWKMITKESIMKAIREKGSYNYTYRLLINGEYKPVCLKIVPVRESGGEKLVAGIRELKQREED